jgi:hypothetical protein
LDWQFQYNLDSWSKIIPENNLFGINLQSKEDLKHLLDKLTQNPHLLAEYIKTYFKSKRGYNIKRWELTEDGYFIFVYSKNQSPAGFCNEMLKDLGINAIFIKEDNLPKDSLTYNEIIHHEKFHNTGECYDDQKSKRGLVMEEGGAVYWSIIQMLNDQSSYSPNISTTYQYAVDIFEYMINTIANFKVDQIMQVLPTVELESSRKQKAEYIFALSTAEKRKMIFDIFVNARFFDSDWVMMKKLINLVQLKSTDPYELNIKSTMEKWFDLKLDLDELRAFIAKYKIN